MTNKSENIIHLIHQFRKHPKWQSFYLKTTRELIDLLDIPPYEIIETNFSELKINEDFCIPLFIRRGEHSFPSLKECFKNSIQNQIVAILNFNEEHHIQNLSVGYLNHNQLTDLEVFEL